MKELIIENIIAMESNLNFETSTGLFSNIRYTRVEDFEKMNGDHSTLKLLIIGEMGTGKSSLCSKFIGIRLMYRQPFEPESKYSDLKRVDTTSLKDHFKVDNSKDSVTKETSFVLSRLLGRTDDHRVMIIDSPGFFDPQTQLGHSQRIELNIPANQDFCQDMKTKLQALGSLDGIILLMNLRQRMTSTFVNTMKGIIYMFENQNDNQLISNLALCYSKCDECESKKYKKKMKNRDQEKTEMLEEFRKHGINYSKGKSPEIFFLTAVNKDLESIGQSAEFSLMMEFFKKSGSISTKFVKNIFSKIKGSWDLQ